MGQVRGVRDFLWRHKYKIGATAAATIALKRIVEHQVAKSYEKSQADMAELARKQVHYDRNKQAGNTTAVAVLPEIKSAVEEHLKCDELIGILKKEQRNPLNRDRATVLKRWDEVKVVVFTELVASVYSLALIVTFLRVQLNILGGYLYVRTMGAAGAEGLPTMSPAIQKAYLSQAQYLRTHGVATLIDRLRPRINALLAAHPIGESPKFELIDFSKCLKDAQFAFEQGGAVEGSMFADFCFAPDAPDEPEPQDGGGSSGGDGSLTLELLMNETRDIVDSAPFVDALHACVKVGFDHVENNLGVKIFSKTSSPGEKPGVWPLAKIIPHIHKEAEALFVGHGPKEGPAVQLLDLKEVEELSMIVYESFCDASPDSSF